MVVTLRYTQLDSVVSYSNTEVYTTRQYEKNYEIIINPIYWCHCSVISETEEGPRTKMFFFLRKILAKNPLNNYFSSNEPSI